MCVDRSKTQEQGGPWRRWDGEAKRENMSLLERVCKWEEVG